MAKGARRRHALLAITLAAMAKSGASTESTEAGQDFPLVGQTHFDQLRDTIVTSVVNWIKDFDTSAPTPAPTNSTNATTTIVPFTPSPSDLPPTTVNPATTVAPAPSTPHPSTTSVYTPSPTTNNPTFTPLPSNVTTAVPAPTTSVPNTPRPSTAAPSLTRTATPFPTQNNTTSPPTSTQTPTSTAATPVPTSSPVATASPAPPTTAVPSTTPSSSPSPLPTNVTTTLLPLPTTKPSNTTTVTPQTTPAATTTPASTLKPGPSTTAPPPTPAPSTSQVPTPYVTTVKPSTPTPTKTVTPSPTANPSNTPAPSTPTNPTTTTPTTAPSPQPTPPNSTTTTAPTPSPNTTTVQPTTPTPNATTVQPTTAAPNTTTVQPTTPAPNTTTVRPLTPSPTTKQPTPNTTTTTVAPTTPEPTSPNSSTVQPITSSPTPTPVRPNVTTTAVPTTTPQPTSTPSTTTNQPVTPSPSTTSSPNATTTTPVPTATPQPTPPNTTTTLAPLTPSPTTSSPNSTTAAPTTTASPTPTSSTPPPRKTTSQPPSTPPATTAAPETSRPTLPVTTSLPFVTARPKETLSPLIQELISSNTSTNNRPPTSTTFADTLLDLSPSIITFSPKATKTEAPETAVPRPAPTPRNYSATASLPDDSLASSYVSVAGSETANTETTRYIFSAVVGVTLVLMAFFHCIAIDPSFVPSDATFVGALTAPNSWELPTFISFMQCIALGSFVNVNAPHAIFVAFTDSFSWLAFQVRKRAPSATPAPALLFQANHGRRLVDANASAYDAFGIEQFALRNHVREKDLFLRAWTFFLIGLAVLMALAIACTVVGRALGQRRGLTGSNTTWMFRSNTHHNNNPMVNFSSSLTSSQPGHVTASHMTRHVLGFTVLLVMVSVLPLSMVSAYEVMQDVNSTAGFGSLTGLFALGALVAVVSAAVGPAFVLTSMSEVDLTKYNTKATFGVLYVNLHYDHRLFGAVSLAVQLLSGVIVALAPSASTQPVWLAGIHVAYLGLVVGVRPFMTALHLVVTVLLELCVVGVFVTMAWMASPATDVQTKRTLAYVVVGVVCCVILFCFARCLVKLWVFVAGWTPSDEEYDETSRGLRRQPTNSQLVVRAGEFGPEKGRHGRPPALPASPINTIQLVKAKPNAIV